MNCATNTNELLSKVVFEMIESSSNPDIRNYFDSI